MLLNEAQAGVITMYPEPTAKRTIFPIRSVPSIHVTMVASSARRGLEKN